MWPAFGPGGFAASLLSPSEIPIPVSLWPQIWQVYYRLLKMQSSHRFLVSKNPFCLYVTNMQEVLLLWVLPWSWSWMESLTLTKGSEELKFVRRGCFWYSRCPPGSCSSSRCSVAGWGCFLKPCWNCHSLCEPTAACCQVHNLQQLIVFVFSRERG